MQHILTFAVDDIHLFPRRYGETLLVIGVYALSCKCLYLQILPICFEMIIGSIFKLLSTISLLYGLGHSEPRRTYDRAHIEVDDGGIIQ